MPTFHRVLFIEDDPGEQHVVRELYHLCQKAYRGQVEFHCVSSWQEAIAQVEVNRPDVVIADLTLPPCTAEDSLENIKLFSPTWPPIIVMTGHEEREEELRVKAIMDSGASDFLIKRRMNRHPEELCERVYVAYLRKSHAAQRTA